MFGSSRGSGGGRGRGRGRRGFQSPVIHLPNLQVIDLVDEDEETQDEDKETHDVDEEAHDEDEEAHDIGEITIVHETQFEQGECSAGPGARVLDPSTFWFDDDNVSRSITEIFQSYLRHPWRNYSEVDANTKLHWWNCFQRKFKWSAELDSQVRKVYAIKAGKRLRDLFYYVTQKCNGKKPKWLQQDVHEGWMKIREDPTFKKKSEQAKKNRRGGSMSNPIEPSHFQGSISASKKAKRLAEKCNGVLPTAGELYVKTHFKEVPGKGNVPCNKKAKQITDAYQKAVEDCREKGVEKDPNQIYFETVGGRKKGQVSGLGNSVDMYYSKPSQQAGGSPNTYKYNPSVGQMSSQIQTQGEQKENEKRLKEMQKWMEEQLQKQYEESEKRVVAEVRKWMAEFRQNWSQCSGSPSPGQPPGPPSGGGSDSACV